VQAYAWLLQSERSGAQAARRHIVQLADRLDAGQRLQVQQLESALHALR
jgi:hypothetical protein